MELRAAGVQQVCVTDRRLGVAFVGCSDALEVSARGGGPVDGCEGVMRVTVLLEEHKPIWRFRKVAQGEEEEHREELHHDDGDSPCPGAVFAELVRED